MDIISLHQELIFDIIYNLHHRDIFNFQSTCSSMNSAINNVDWKDYFLTRIDPILSEYYRAAHSQLIIDRRFIIFESDELIAITDEKIHQQYIKIWPHISNLDIIDLYKNID